MNAVNNQTISDAKRRNRRGNILINPPFQLEWVMLIGVNVIGITTR